MEKILTVVIPTYNMEKLLDRCLTSLILEDKDLMKQLEVLVVIDGAKDRSSEIAHSYQDRYPYTFRVIDKENGNYGSCINRGLKEATGLYFKILDADDWYDSKALAEYLMRIKVTDADALVTDFTIVSEGSMPKVMTKELQDGMVYDINDINNAMKVGTIRMHALTIKTQILRDINYTQTEGISYTDTEFTYFPFFRVSTVQYNAINVYQYMVGREGQTMDPKSLAKNIPAFKKVAVRMIEKLSSTDMSELSEGRQYILKEHISYIVNAVAGYVLYYLPINKDRQAELKLVDDKLKSLPEIYKITGDLSIGGYRYLSYWRSNNKDMRCTISFGMREFLACLFGKRAYSIANIFNL